MRIEGSSHPAPPAIDLPILTLTRVTKTYGTGQAAVHALRGVDLVVTEGEFVAVMGPSGSGKSTAMNIVGCLDVPTGGAYCFCGVNVGDLTQNQRALLRRQYLGFVFQGFNLLGRTSALENVELPLVYRGLPPAERHARAREALARVGLAGWEHHTPAELSGGQLQRVAIARAMVAEPSVLLADEPTGNLDTARSHEIMELLTRFNREQNLTIVMVTHEPDMAAYAGRTVKFKDGLVESDERREERGGARRTEREVQERPGEEPRAAGRARLSSMLANALLLALREIRRNVLRSSLTTLGIVIGVGAVIVMVTLGSGATAQVTSEIQSLGSNLLAIMPGQQMGPGGARGTAEQFDVDLTDALAREVTALTAVAPIASQSMSAIAGGENWSTTVTGTTNEYLDVQSWSVESGRRFTDAEVRGGTAVCLIGATVRAELFGKRDPLGERIRLGTLSCQIVGLLAAKGRMAMGQDRDDVVLVPLRTFQRRIAGNEDVNMIQVGVRSTASIAKAKRDIEWLLRERRRIAIGEEDDFSIMDPQDIASTLTGTTRVLTALLAAVASVSLLVGGIGIMNIMLVSVTERTREIGIRLAIGALGREVLTQFLVEAVALSGFGGLVGVALAIGASAVSARALAVPLVLSPTMIVGAFLFSCAVGVIFGYFPARRAAALNPIDALRHE